MQAEANGWLDLAVPFGPRHRNVDALAELGQVDAAQRVQAGTATWSVFRLMAKLNQLDLARGKHPRRSGGLNALDTLFCKQSCPPQSTDWRRQLGRAPAYAKISATFAPTRRRKRSFPTELARWRNHIAAGL